MEEQFKEVKNFEKKLYYNFILAVWLVRMIVQNICVKLKYDILADLAHVLIPIGMEKMSANFDENQDNI